MEKSALSTALRRVRKTTPLVHSITNYVTVNDCANALLACGGSPIMSDEPLDVGDIQAICGGLVLNIRSRLYTIQVLRLMIISVLVLKMLSQILMLLLNNLNHGLRNR